MSFSSFKKFLKPPTFNDQYPMRLIILLHVSLWVSIFASITFNFFLFLVFSNPIPHLGVNIVFLIILIMLLYLLHQGHFRITVTLLLVTSWIYITLILYFFGGIRNPALNGFILIILLTGLVLGKQGILVASLLSFISVFGLLSIEVNGSLPQSLIVLSDNYIWSTVITILVATTVFLYLAINILDKNHENLRVNEHLNRTLIEYSDMVLCRWLPDTSLTYVNEKYRQALNIPDELDGVKWVDFLPEKFHEETLAFYQNSINHLEVSIHEQRVITHSGQERYFQWIDTPIYNDDEHIIEFQSVGVDITDLKEAEKAIRISERKYRQLFENMTNGFAIHNTIVDDDNKVVDLIFLEINEAFSEILGLKSQDIIGKKISSIVPRIKNESKYYLDALGEVAFNAKQTRFELFSRTYKRWFSILVFSPNIGQVATILEDISERKNAEVSLRDSESRLKEAQKITCLGSWNWDIQTNHFYWSDEMYAIYGLPITKQPDLQLVLDLILEEDLSFYEQAFSNIASGIIPDSVEYRIRRKDGRIRYLILRAQSNIDESGQISRLAGTLQDITERKELEEQLRLSQKMEAVGQLTAGIAHDFNNILTAINGSAQLLQYKLPKDDPLRKLADRIANSGEHAASLISELMAFSRKQILEPQIVSFNKSIEQINTILDRTIGDHIFLHTHFAQDLWPIKIDPSQANQLIVNLVVNARDAMPSGGNLYIETSNISITEKNYDTYIQVPKGEYVLLKVRDTGVGISQEIKPRIFEPFFTTKEIGQGTGLGLATVYAIVTQNNGEIRVQSIEGEGTTFYIYFPKANSHLRQLSKPLNPLSITQGTETILLVEDSAEVRELAIDILEMQGYTILPAVDGIQALEIVASSARNIDLLLTDVMMPQLNGKQLADQLIEKLPNLRVIFMSGYTNEIIAKQGILETDITFLQKPFTPAQLIHKVRQTLKNNHF